MIILGLTGSIGMGKSTTAKMFVEQGVPVHDADAQVHALYQSGPVMAQIEAAFPGSVGEHGVDRKKLGAAVFGNAEALKKLEAIVHPLVQRAERAFLEKQKSENARLVVFDIPLLFETGGDKRVDKVLVVTAPAEVQRQRVLERPDMDEERLAAILAKQMPDAEKRARADFILDTSLGMDAARSEVTKIIDQLIA